MRLDVGNDVNAHAAVRTGISWADLLGCIRLQSRMLAAIHLRLGLKAGSAAHSNKLLSNAQLLCVTDSYCEPNLRCLQRAKTETYTAFQT